MLNDPILNDKLTFRHTNMRKLEMQMHMALCCFSNIDLDPADL